MNKVLAIARYEYLRHVRRRAFLLTGLGLPLLIGVVIAVVALVIVFVGAEHGIGVVDPTRRWASVSLRQLDTNRPIPTRRFRDETTARAALDAGSIDAYL